MNSPSYILPLYSSLLTQLIILQSFGGAPPVEDTVLWHGQKNYNYLNPESLTAEVRFGADSCASFIGYFLLSCSFHRKRSSNGTAATMWSP